MKSQRISSLRLGLFFFVLALVVFGGALWWKDAMSPVDPTNTTSYNFVIHRGEGVKIIAARLSGQHLIRSPTGFFILVKLLRIEKDLEAGDYRLRQTMSAADVARELTHGITDVWVTTLEGWRSEEIANKLSKELDIPEAEFLKYAREGYMFPDTYLIPKDATPSAVADLFLETFDKKITKQMRNDSQKLGLSFNDVVILASIVEREGRTDTDRPVIAGILLKRLRAGWPLQADATVQYALGYQPLSKSWWKKYLEDNDKKTNSPFNTYLSAGLPPRPIANPGLAAIKSVIYPIDSDYWYYLHDGNGQVHFAKTIEEQNANIEKYL